MIKDTIVFKKLRITSTVFDSKRIASLKYTNTFDVLPFNEKLRRIAEQTAKGIALVVD